MARRRAEIFIERSDRIIFTILLGIANAVVNNAARISVFNRPDVFPFAASLLSFDVVFAKSYGVPRGTFVTEFENEFRNR